MKRSTWWSQLLTGKSRSRTARRSRERWHGHRLSLESMEPRTVLSAVHDYLYIGDQGDPNDLHDDTVKRFDAKTGAYVDTFVAPGAGGLNGPRGLIFRNPGALMVAGQNPCEDCDENGNVLRFNGKTGQFIDATVAATDLDAPYAPRGMVLQDNTLFVANVQLDANTDVGSIERYDVNSGKYLGSLTPTNYPGQFNPRGVVFGPDGHL